MAGIVILWLILLIVGLLLIVWGADTTLDNLKEIGEKYHLSPIILTLIIMGVDLEELIASVSSASQNLPEIAIGNVIGNNIISLTFILALPTFFHRVVFRKSTTNKIFGFMFLFTLNLVISLFFLDKLWLFGIIALILFSIYIVYAFLNIKDDLTEEYELKEEIEMEKEEILSEHTEEIWKKIGFFIIGILVMYGGAELFVYCIIRILEISRLNESFIGLIIIAAGTNVEEYSLLFKSIKKNCADLGIASLIGKIIWNSGVTFGVSALIIGTTADISLNIVVNGILLSFLIIPYFIYLISRKIHPKQSHGLILIILFISYLLFSIFL